MKELKKELEEIFNDIELDEETEEFIVMLSEKIEYVRKNNNNIANDQSKFEDILYNLHKLIPEQITGNNNDKKNS